MAEFPDAVVAVAERAREVMATALDRLGPHLLGATGDVAVESKGDGTPVTAADLDADDLVAGAVADAFPRHGVMSEERRTVAPDTEWTWIVDPIDGTSNFICGLPYWCVSVALAHQGRPVLGMIDAPAMGRRYTAVTGAGARVQTRLAAADGSLQVADDRRLKVRPASDWRSGRNRHVPVMLTTSTARRAREAKLRLNPRVMGSTALDLAFVAEGIAAASVAAIPKVWDIAAGALLVTEAGGVVETMSGEPHLPVRPGVEHHGRSAATAAGPTSPYTRDLAERVLPER